MVRVVVAMAMSAAAFAPVRPVLGRVARGGASRAAFYDLTETANDGSSVSFSQFEGKVCFAQNVASA